MKKLEADANCILNFMASNGLVANQAKTVFMILNEKRSSKTINPRQIKVGDMWINQSVSSKLLGMEISDNQDWQDHFHGAKGLLSSLNQRLFAIKRLTVVNCMTS